MKSLFDNLKDSLGNFANNTSQNNSSNNLSSLLGAGAVGGLLGALLGGSKGIRNVAKNVAVVGAGAAAATLAYKMLQKWKQNQNPQEVNIQNPFTYSNQQNAQSSQALQTADDSQALLVLQAMIFSARADGHIDDEEKTLIDKCSSQLGAANIQNEIQKFMNCPLDPKEIALKVKSKEQAIDIYTLSSTIIYCDNFMEESYLNGLAQALKISSEEKKALDNKAKNLRESLKG